jgi:hypothetical protein
MASINCDTSAPIDWRWPESSVPLAPSMDQIAGA